MTNVWVSRNFRKVPQQIPNCSVYFNNQSNKVDSQTTLNMMPLCFVVKQIKINKSWILNIFPFQQYFGFDLLSLVDLNTLTLWHSLNTCMTHMHEHNQLCGIINTPDNCNVFILMLLDRGVKWFMCWAFPQLFCLFMLIKMWKHIYIYVVNARNQRGDNQVQMCSMHY